MMAQGVAMLKKRGAARRGVFVQPVGPGHFQNYQQMFQETLGVPPEDPSVE